MKSKCEKCGKISIGDYGEVYYTSKIGAKSETANLGIVKIKSNETTYKLEGYKKKFICKNCVNNSMKKWGLINLVLFLVTPSLLYLIIYLVIKESINDTLWIFSVLILIPFLGFSTIYLFIKLIQKLLWRRYRRKTTDQIAIDVLQKEMDSPTLYTFWDRFEIRKLRKK